MMCIVAEANEVTSEAGYRDLHGLTQQAQLDPVPMIINLPTPIITNSPPHCIKVACWLHLLSGVGGGNIKGGDYIANATWFPPRQTWVDYTWLSMGFGLKVVQWVLPLARPKQWSNPAGFGISLGA